MQKLIKTFIATDSEGRKYPLRVYQDVLPSPTFENPNNVVRGLASIKTFDGKAVNLLEKGHYKIGTSGVDLYSSDPNAP